MYQAPGTKHAPVAIHKLYVSHWLSERYHTNEKVGRGHCSHTAVSYLVCRLDSWWGKGTSTRTRTQLPIYIYIWYCRTIAATRYWYEIPPYAVRRTRYWYLVSFSCARNSRSRIFVIVVNLCLLIARVWWRAYHGCLTLLERSP